jgi:hypothetical protein
MGVGIELSGKAQAQALGMSTKRLTIRSHQGKSILATGRVAVTRRGRQSGGNQGPRS